MFTVICTFTTPDPTSGYRSLALYTYNRFRFFFFLDYFNALNSNTHFNFNPIQGSTTAEGYNYSNPANNFSYDPHLPGNDTRY